MANTQINPALVTFKANANQAAAAIEQMTGKDNRCRDARQLLRDMRCEQAKYTGNENWLVGDVYVRVHRIIRKAVIGF